MQRRLSELQRRLSSGEISRRDFLRSAAILGISLGASEILAACDLAPGQPVPPRLEDLALEENNRFPTPSGLGDVPTHTPGPSPTSFPTNTPSAPKQISWFCAGCGARFRTVDELKRHAVSEHGWRLPEIRKVEEPTYSPYLNEDLKRFDQKYTIFNRARWDEEYIAQVQEYRAKAPKGDWDWFEGQALVAGAIYVDSTAGSLHPGYYGYDGHIKGVGGLYDWDDPVNKEKFPVPDPAWMSARVKEVAKFYGASLVGITRVDPRWVYSHYFSGATGDYQAFNIPYKYAIMIGIEMDYDWINEAPDPEASAAAALGYSQMAEVASSLAKYIRALGYPAVPSGNDTGQNIPMAIDAGLGELGRNGLLLTPEYGARLRLCKVLTDLPLEVDQPIDFGIQSFCETCHACAASCPVDAVRWEDRTTEQTSVSNRPGILRWPVDVARCYLFWQENGVSCANCIAGCPWALHSTRDWLEL